MKKMFLLVSATGFPLCKGNENRKKAKNVEQEWERKNENRQMVPFQSGRFGQIEKNLTNSTVWTHAKI
jgi:hypothetical protein